MLITAVILLNVRETFKPSCKFQSYALAHSTIESQRKPLRRLKDKVEYDTKSRFRAQQGGVKTVSRLHLPFPHSSEAVIPITNFPR
jgi:hypothetical protein